MGNICSALEDGFIAEVQNTEISKNPSHKKTKSGVVILKFGKINLKKQILELVTKS